MTPRENVTPSIAPTYWYEGRCPKTDKLLRLPRTIEVEAIACNLMQELANDPRYAQEGKMYGVLLVETARGKRQVLRAFSGLLWGQSTVPGWVPPIPGRESVALEEARTLGLLEAIKQELIALQQLPERQQYDQLATDFAQQLQQVTLAQKERKQVRQAQRQQLEKSLCGSELALALEELDEQSRQDGLVRRRLKREQEQQLQPLKQAIEQADLRIQQLKKNRKQLSRHLQTQLHEAYQLTNFTGTSLPLNQVFSKGIPTGTGDCCAPKLLHYAAIMDLTPLAMAEFWWGPTSLNGEKQPGKFYGACAERCQPLMGFLLSGLSNPVKNNHTSHGIVFAVSSENKIPILYQDEVLIVVDKPAGLLSVPGRYLHTQDSVVTLLRHNCPGLHDLTAVHRLDQDTSGILLLACTPSVYRQLSQQFQKRQVQKVYEAVLDGVLVQERGEIEIPLWADPIDRPYQKVDWQRGKPSRTLFQVLHRDAQGTRIELIPETGRTHQLRVHAADPQGLGIPIRGDRLYGKPTSLERLHLHARELVVHHPLTGHPLSFKSPTPF